MRKQSAQPALPLVVSTLSFSEWLMDPQGTLAVTAPSLSLHSHCWSCFCLLTFQHQPSLCVLPLFVLLGLGKGGFLVYGMPQLQLPAEIKMLGHYRCGFEKGTNCLADNFFHHPAHSVRMQLVLLKNAGIERAVVEKLHKEGAQAVGVDRLCCFLPSLSPFHLWHQHLDCSCHLGLSPSSVAPFFGSKRASLFSSVLKS